MHLPAGGAGGAGRRPRHVSLIYLDTLILNLESLNQPRRACARNRFHPLAALQRGIVSGHDRWCTNPQLRILQVHSTKLLKSFFCMTHPTFRTTPAPAEPSSCQLLAGSTASCLSDTWPCDAAQTRLGTESSEVAKSSHHSDGMTGCVCRCVVIEDSHIGVRAARAAGMRCGRTPVAPALGQSGSIP